MNSHVKEAIKKYRKSTAFVSFLQSDFSNHHWNGIKSNSEIAFEYNLKWSLRNWPKKEKNKLCCHEGKRSGAAVQKRRRVWWPDFFGDFPAFPAFYYFVCKLCVLQLYCMSFNKKWRFSELNKSALSSIIRKKILTKKTKRIHRKMP